ncbi:DUF2127 domain-containing protein [Corynebacterium sp. ES2794-CONJ1]|uniref:DUF2127 domain-containing protein n=1 Tax=unclassified Corynebacterium TaxID=2624378 RepID=UPI00216AD292|nr:MULTISPECIES: DUF2127 domain-containing protein [unclassified Corynebacterium]MCS4532367.1 DUF2127 domain-containing protein [Corynebacterium sp. ES2730-CONJ]MCU9519670.1 DUF2127 domain-containing protein [Corynebacterium sp. ES2794-CONJ1]
MSLKNADLSTQDKVLIRTFKATLWFKLILGFFELILAALIKVIPVERWRDMAEWLTRDQLLADPSAPFARAVINSVDSIDISTQNYIVFYLVVHAVVKTILIVAVLRGKLWAYPLMIAVLVGFVVYQSYEMYFEVTIGLLTLTIIDIILIWLTIHEWRIKTRLKF